jgi:hypothetical protein
LYYKYAKEKIMEIKSYAICEKCKQEIKAKEDGVLLAGGLVYANLDVKGEDMILGDLDVVTGQSVVKIDDTFAFHFPCLLGFLRELKKTVGKLEDTME